MIGTNSRTLCGLRSSARYGFVRKGFEVWIVEIAAEHAFQAARKFPAKKPEIFLKQ
jgi:hypothetical protein